MELKAAIISLGSESSERTFEAMRKYFSKVDYLDIKKIEISISGKTSEILYDGKTIDEYDCVYGNWQQ